MKDLLKVKEKYVDFLWNGGFREYVEEGKHQCLSELLENLTEADDGSFYWADIDYTNQNGMKWIPSYHYIRLESAIIMAGKKKITEDTKLRNKFIGAARHWIIHKYHCPNWWHNCIGMPCHIGDISLLLWEYFNSNDRAELIELTGQGNKLIKERMGRQGGANLVWDTYNAIKVALLTENEELLAESVNTIANEIKITNGEGIQEDYSFYQHGPRWYSGGYGQSFSFDVSQLIYLMYGTKYMFSREKLEIFLHHLLDGQRNMMHHGIFDYSGVGRELSREDTLYSRGIRFAAEILSKIPDMPRHDELVNFDRDNKFGYTVDENHDYKKTTFYPRSSLLTHKKNGSYIGVKCHNAHQFDAENMGGEAIYCYNMSYGTHYCLMRKGNEYLNMLAFYEWNHVPGTTARLESDEDLLKYLQWRDNQLPNDKTRGIAEGDLGIITEFAEHDGISAWVTFFTFDGCLIALGTGIKDENQEKAPLSTTIDQCLADNPTEGTDGTVSNGGFTYVNLDSNTEIVWESGIRKGSWHKNNVETPFKEIEGDMFTAYIPVKKGYDSYAYAAIPRGGELKARVISNTEDIQSIELSDGTVLIADHVKGECIIENEQ